MQDKTSSAEDTRTTLIRKQGAKWGGKEILLGYLGLFHRKKPKFLT